MDTGALSANVLALEPWNGGSHRQFLEQWRAASRHRIQIEGLPARHWKWRMRSAPWELARRVTGSPHARPDVLLVTDYIDLPELYGWLPPPWADVPSLLYFHENQLTYPAGESTGSDPPDGSERGDRDDHYGFTNVLSCLRANRIAFNSEYHRREFAVAADRLLARLPRPNPRAQLEASLARSEVIPPGIDVTAIRLGPGPAADAPLRVLFSHRWEHDKAPEAFLAAMVAAKRLGARFELVLLGESYPRRPAGVDELLRELDPLIHTRGFQPDRASYVTALGHADVVVSTARHEFFGMAVLEGMAAGCRPLVPRRLVYPEVVGDVVSDVVGGVVGDDVMYDDDSALARLVVQLAADPTPIRSVEARRRIRDAVVERFGAARTADRLDRICDDLSRRRPESLGP